MFLGVIQPASAGATTDMAPATAGVAAQLLGNLPAPLGAGRCMEWI